MISLYKLEIFETVVEEGSFSAAAARLYISQAAVSQHIQGLEASLGTKLFDRRRRGVRLTTAGEILRGYTHGILQLVAEAENAVTDVEQLSAGQIRIGATPGAGMYLLPDWMRSFQGRFPNLSLALTTDVTAHIAVGVLNHTFDIGFVESEVEDKTGRLEVLFLQPVEQYVIIGNKHPWCELDAVPIEALQGQRLIMRPRDSQTRAWLDRLFVQHGISPTIVAELDNPESIKQAVISGMGIAIMPEYVIQREQTLQYLCALPITNAVLRRSLALVWNRDESFKPITRAFLTQLADRFPQLLKLRQVYPAAGALIT
ncbi:MAG: LysR family transcriptional regulator [Aggregatilineales bacterium]